MRKEITYISLPHTGDPISNKLCTVAKLYDKTTIQYQYKLLKYEVMKKKKHVGAVSVPMHHSIYNGTWTLPKI